MTTSACAHICLACQHNTYPHIRRIGAFEFPSHAGTDPQDNDEDSPDQPLPLYVLAEVGLAHTLPDSVSVQVRLHLLDGRYQVCLLYHTQVGSVACSRHTLHT